MRLYAALALAVAVLVGLGASYLLGQRTASQRVILDGLRADQSTQEAITDAINDSLSTGDGWFDRLCATAANEQRDLCRDRP